MHDGGRLKQTKQRAGLVSSYSQGANKLREEDKEDDDAMINEYMDKIPLNDSFKDGERHGGGTALPKTPVTVTDTKEKSGGGDW